jgi:hypothetical protein
MNIHRGHCMSLSKDVSCVLGLSTSYPNDSWKCKINDKLDYRLNHLEKKVTDLRKRNKLSKG